MQQKLGLFTVNQYYYNLNFSAAIHNIFRPPTSPRIVSFTRKVKIQTLRLQFLNEPIEAGLFFEFIKVRFTNFGILVLISYSESPCPESRHFVGLQSFTRSHISTRIQSRNENQIGNLETSDSETFNRNTGIKKVPLVCYVMKKFCLTRYTVVCQPPILL